MERLTAIAIMLSAGPLSAAPVPQVVVPTVAEGPQLQGDLTDPAWQQAAKADGFTLIDTGERPAAQTEAYVLCDSSHLYVGFVCHEPNMGRLVTETSGHGGPVKTDDCVELIIDPPNGDTWCYEIAVNSGGVHWDALHTPAGSGGRQSTGVESRGKKAADRWTCELRVPFENLGGAPRPGEVWGLNFCRARRTGDDPELTSWSPAPMGFGVAETCGEAVFAPAEGPLVVRVPSRGGVCADANETGRNVFVAHVRNAAQKAARIEAAVSVDDAPLATEEIELQPGAERQLRLPYDLPFGEQPLCRFTVAAARKQVYESALQAVKPTYRGPRTWQVTDPLFEELLGDQPPGLRKEGTLFWGHLNNVNILRETAKRFAVRYTEHDAYQEHVDHRLILIGHGVVRDLDHPHPIARYRVRNAPIPGRQPEGVPWMLDPRSIRAASANTEAFLTGPHPLVFAMFAGDEVEDIALKQGARLMARPGDYDYIKQADEEVRREFGGGKWGIPAGLAERDPNPYKWIAFRRWVNARLRKRHRRMREIMKQHDPKLPFLSTDSGGLVPLEWSSRADNFDLFTIQTSCLRDPWRAQPGCLTKAIVDLTGKDFWPCAHVENYGMNTTPQEVVEELSQVFRNGGTGLHLYMADTANSRKMVGDTRVPYFGSPRRWHTVTNILDLLREMPQPRYPDYDRTAILFNDDTLQATPYDAYRPYADQTEACYTFLGPVARSWFKFIDCAQVLKWSSLAERFDVIFLPCAQYQRIEVVAKLRRFVEEGGTLICGDPQAFDTDLVGNDTTGSRRELFGVDVEEKTNLAKLRPTFANPGVELALKGEAHRLALGEGTTVLATYEDGSPAVAGHSIGNGRAILFGCNPFSLDAVPDVKWRDFFAAWVKELGAPTGLDIWRFRFPDSVIWHEPEQLGVCLTNNRVLWQEEKPRFTQNVDTGGSYQFSLPPDGMPDAVEGAVPFSEGHLTDRRKSIMARKTAGGYADYALPPSRWMVQWTKPDPVAVTFDLVEPRKLLELKLWFCDTLPALAVEGSADGTRWLALGEADGQQAGEDVFDLVVKLAEAEPCCYLRVNFEARQDNEKLTLVEAEVWGEEMTAR